MNRVKFVSRWLTAAVAAASLGATAHAAVFTTSGASTVFDPDNGDPCNVIESDCSFIDGLTFPPGFTSPMIPSGSDPFTVAVDQAGRTDPTGPLGPVVSIKVPNGASVTVEIYFDVFNWDSSVGAGGTKKVEWASDFNLTDDTGGAPATGPAFLNITTMPTSVEVVGPIGSGFTRVFASFGLVNNAADDAMFQGFNVTNLEFEEVDAANGLSSFLQQLAVRVRWYPGRGVLRILLPGEVRGW